MPRIPQLSETKPRRRYFKSTIDLAKYLGMSRRTLTDWERDGILDGCRTDKGQWNTDRVWEVAKARIDAAELPIGETYDSPWLEKLREWKAKQEELKYYQARGDLIEKDSVDRMMEARVMVLKRTLLNIPHQLASRLAATTSAKECRGIVLTRIEDAIRTYQTMEPEEETPTP